MVDKVRLAKLKHFYDHVQRDRNHMGVGYPVDQKLNKDLSNRCITIKIKITMFGSICLCPVERENCESYDNKDLEQEDCVKHVVHHLHHI